MLTKMFTKMFTRENIKNSPFVLAGGIGLAVLLGGCGGNNADTADTTPAAAPVRAAKPAGEGAAATPTQAGKSAPKAPGSPAAAGKQAKAGAKGGDGTTPSDVPAAAQPAPSGLAGSPAANGTPPPGAPAAPKAPATKVASIPDHRKDPFFIDWKAIPPPPYVFNDPSIQPLRVASRDVETPPVGDVAVREVANRRVSGIMSGDGVFAILETAGGQDSEIVKPGSQTKDGYRVVSISADSVKLQRKDGNIVRTQVVPLSDQSLGGAGGGGGMFGGGAFGGGRPGGLPGSGGGRPGGMPGSGGRPGRGGFPGGGGGGRRGGGAAGGGAGSAD